MDPLVRQLLRLALYQIACMDSVPESAAVNESVSLAKEMGKGRPPGLLTACCAPFAGRRQNMSAGAGSGPG